MSRDYEEAWDVTTPDVDALVERVREGLPASKQGMHRAPHAALATLADRVKELERDVAGVCQREEAALVRARRAEAEVMILKNGCEQALLLLERERFTDDSEAKVVRAVLRSALSEEPRQ